MLAGRNPYEQLRLYSRNPGHIREYTKQELVGIAAAVGLDCASHSYNDWIQRRKGSRMKRCLMGLLHAYPAFRPFQTLVFARREEGAPARSDRRSAERIHSSNTSRLTENPAHMAIPKN